MLREGQKLIRDYTESLKSLAIFFFHINRHNTNTQLWENKLWKEKKKKTARGYNRDRWICFFGWQRYEYFTPCYAKLSHVHLFLQPCGLEPARLLCHGISQQITLEWLLCPPPGDLPNPGIKPTCPAAPALWILYRWSHWGSKGNGKRKRDNDEMVSGWPSDQFPSSLLKAAQ